MIVAVDSRLDFFATNALDLLLLSFIEVGCPTYSSNSAVIISMKYSV